MTVHSQLLCRVRTNSCTTEDIDTLKYRVILSDALNYPTQALHVYRLNADVDKRNALMLDNLTPQSAQYTIKAKDDRAGQTSHISLSVVSNKRSETGGLHLCWCIFVGAPTKIFKPHSQISRLGMWTICFPIYTKILFIGLFF